ncbi:MAG: PAS domain-containing protein [Proteobacteria bacterium]|nr:PAS domain-containing protein [Pseudomonadota bacterium]
MPIWSRSAQPGIDNDTMRCIVDEKGNVVFASPAVGWSLGINATTLASKPIGAVLDVVSSHDSHHQALDFSELVSGFYDVALLRQKRDPLILQARIDRIDAPDRKKFTVVWLDPDNRLKRQKNNDFNQAASAFATFIIDTQKKSEEKFCEQAPELGYISKADGELRHFLNLTSDLLGVYRRDGSFVRVNPAFNSILGFSDGELKLFPFIDLILPEDRDRVQALMQHMLQAPVDQEMRIDFESGARCKDGSTRWLKWIHKVMGEHIYIVARDVTNIKQHEAELCRREAQLLESQKIGRMGHWYWEVDRQIMEWSDQIYTIFGVDKNNFSPTVDNINALLLKRDLGRIHRAFQRALLRKKDYQLEFRLRFPRGGIRYIHCEGRCKVNVKTGQVEALFGIMQDITERTLHEKALREAKDAAEQAYASKTRFLANMSHELRTPLNAIIGFSEMIQRQLLGPVGNARYLDYIGGIHESGEHLLNLINDILDMSKIEIGKYELYVEEINVGKIIRLAVHMVEGRAQEAQVRLILDDLPDYVQIVADRRALMQILLNILSNAVKFTNPGGSVEIRCQQELGGVAIVVSDTGVGIPKDKIGIVTMPFEQVDSELTRKHEGSGLGLAITKDLINLHGGTLDIASELGIGTTVTVLLPAKLSESSNVRAAVNAATMPEMVG